jgi:hypothetical protein
MYAVLVDLSDAVAEAVQLPLERISMEMFAEVLYHFQYALLPLNQRLEVAGPSLRRSCRIEDYGGRFQD